MAIETSNPSHSVRQSKHADSHKGTKDASDKAQGTGGADFMALLADMAADGTSDGAGSAGLEVDTLAGMGDAAAQQLQADPGLVMSPTDSSGLQTTAPSPMPMATLDVATAGGFNDATRIGQLSALASDASAGAIPGDTATPVHAILEGLGGVGTRDAQSLKPSMPPAGPLRAQGAGQPIEAAAPQSGDPTSALQLQPTGKSTKSFKAVVVDDATSLAQDPSTTASIAKTASAEQRVQSLIFRQMEMQPTAMPLVAAVSQEINGLVRESARGRLADKQAGAEAVLANPVYTPMEPGAAVVETAPAFETVVAEKIAYWVANDVHKAELKLDGLGEQPVEVSIRMHGNEAHVAFRTDELQTRSALEQAGSDLKDMLQREGLTLAGVSVGTTGSGNGQRNSERKTAASARQGRVEVVVSPQISAARTQGTGVGRSLDLFV